VPVDGHVFIDADYSQIELVVLAYVCERQFGLQSELARLNNTGEDVHRLIAAAVLGKSLDQIVKSERNSAKPVSFGRPGGMGAERLRLVAKAGYGVDLTLEGVEERIQAYHRLCPELDAFLTDEVEVGQVLAKRLSLTPALYYQAVGRHYHSADPGNFVAEGWLGGMLLKVLRDEAPLTANGRLYSPEEIDFFWNAAQPLAQHLDDDLAAKLAARESSRKLWAAVRDWAGRRSVFTVTGRLRANTTLCSARNCVFQGPGADGAILGLWRVWRAGHQIVDFVHDQVVVESPGHGDRAARKEAIVRLMKEGMEEVVPGMRVAVECVVTSSLNKTELVTQNGGRQEDAFPGARDTEVRATAMGPAVFHRRRTDTA